MESAFSRSAQICAGIGSPVRMYWSALTSYSWKSKPAPAARRTLIASGTTSLPAPSQGKTAMWLGRGHFLLAQLVALDLAGHGLGQVGHELDQVRVLEALEARLAVLLQLGDKRVAGDSVLLQDDECLDPREAVDRHADGLALRDGLSLDVEDLQLVSRDRLAARAWPHVVESVRAVDVEHLGRPDAVEDRKPESVLPTPPDFGGQRLRGGHAMPDRAEVAA